MVLVIVALTSLAVGSRLHTESARVQEDLRRRTALLAAEIATAVAERSATLQTLATVLQTKVLTDTPALRRALTELTQRDDALLLAAWVPRISRSQREFYELGQQGNGRPDFAIRQTDRFGNRLTASPRDAYFPIHVAAGPALEAPECCGLATFEGSDLAAVARIGTALNRSAEAGSELRTIALQEPEAEAHLVLLAVPALAPPSGPSVSPQVPLGYVIGIVDLERALGGMFAGIDATWFDVELRAAGDSDGEAQVLWSHASTASPPSGPLWELWTLIGSPEYTRTAPLGSGLSWILHSLASERLVASNLGWTPWWFAIGGLISALLMASTIGNHDRNRRIIDHLQRQLERTKLDASKRMAVLDEALERERADRKHTEESLFREKQQFRLMFNAVPAMIWYKDTKNRFLLVNEAAAEWMQRSVAEIEGKPCGDIFAERANELYREDLEVINSGKPKLAMVEEVTTADGRTRWIRTDRLPEYDAMGRVVGILVFSQDISEQRDTQQEVHRLNEELERRVVDRTRQLEAANEELESFAYSVSHDLRTPLRSIDGFSQVLLEDYSDGVDAMGREYLQRVRAASQRMGQLIDDLLKLTRVSRGELDRHTVDLSAIARDVAEELAHATPERVGQWVIEPTPECQGDFVLLRNVMENLLGNAWKFTSTRDEPRIEFGCETDEQGHSVYFVRDNGVGFDNIYADKVFGAFQRLHSATEFEGSGIGLASAQLIIRRHGGRIWAKSEPDEGACFYFTLEGHEEA